MAPTLMDIQDEIANVLTAFTGHDPDCETYNAVEAYLAELATAEVNKVEGYLVAEAKTQSEIDWLEEQAKVYTARAKSLKADMQWRKGHLLRVMQEHGLRKMQGRSGSITRQESPASLQLDMERLPDNYKRTVITTEADRNCIQNDLNAGIDVPGAELVRGEHVRLNRARAKAANA